MRNLRIVAIVFGILLMTAGAAVAQDTGNIKGRVKAKGQGPLPEVAVSVRQSDREVASAVTDSKGEFLVKGLAPGLYQLTFRKTGLSVGSLEHVEVKAGKTKSLPDRLILTPNEASTARLWSSVFDEGGYIVRGARLELARLEANGVPRKIDGRLTNESGQAVFKLSPEKAMYRVTVRLDGGTTQTKDVEIDGAMVYRVAFTVARPPN